MCSKTVKCESEDGVKKGRREVLFKLRYFPKPKCFMSAFKSDPTSGVRRPSL